MLAESGITSANVVGYQGLGYESAKKPLVGFTFVPVSGATTIKLGDVKAVGMEMDPDTDAIQLLDPDTTKMQALHTYVSKELAEEWELDEESVGWWDLAKYGPSEGDESRNNVAVKAGATFLLLNNKAHTLTFQYKSALDVTKPAAE